MSPKSLLLSPLLLILILITSLPTTTSLNSTDYIRRSCAATLYPSLCFNSLSRYAATVHQSPVHLAYLAANLTLSRVRSLSSQISSLSLTGAREAAALRDCGDSLSDAADQVNMSVGEIGALDSAEGPEVAWRVSNAQTWMSAALTDEDTCEDGFQGVGRGSPVRDDVCRRVRRAKQYTSNALALVNSLVAGRR